jgi:hypothetical protein
MTDQFDSYLSGLPGHRQQQFVTLRQAVAERVASAPDIANFVFLPGQVDHPRFSDAAEVFWLAAEQLSFDAATGELPLLFIGAHSMSVLTRKRESLGFLLTDRKVITQADVSALFRAQPPVDYPFFRGETVTELIEAVRRDYDWRYSKSLVTVPDREVFLGLLGDAAASVVDLLGELPERPAVVRATDVRSRAEELGLSDVVRYPDNPKFAKHFAKIAKGFVLPAGATVRIAVTDATIAGPYGLVVTETAVHSKDLMETPETTQLADLRDGRIRFSDDGKTLLLGAEDTPHTFPAHLDATQKNALLVILGELADGDIE